MRPLSAAARACPGLLLLAVLACREHNPAYRIGSASLEPDGGVSADASSGTGGRTAGTGGGMAGDSGAAGGRDAAPSTPFPPDATATGGGAGSTGGQAGSTGGTGGSAGAQGLAPDAGSAGAPGSTVDAREAPPLPPLDASPEVAAPVDGASNPDLAAASTDPSRYNFETSTQTWSDLRNGPAIVSRSTTRSFLGTASLAVDLDLPVFGDGNVVGVAQTFGSTLPPGTRVTFHVWFPAGSGLHGMQPYVLYVPRSGGPQWHGVYSYAWDLSAGQWNALDVVVPTDSTGVVELGLHFASETTWRGRVYVDAVTW